MVYSKEEEPYICLFCLYLAGRRPNTYSNEWFVALTEWLITDKKVWGRTADVGPDMCGRCLTCFGLTMGGRLRDGCYLCNAREDTKIWELPYIGQVLKVGDEILELLFAKALYIYNSNSNSNDNDRERGINRTHPDIMDSEPKE